MLKVSNIIGWTLALALFAGGEKAPMHILLPLAGITIACLWISSESHRQFKHQTFIAAAEVPDAPVASQVSRDLGIMI